MGRDADSTGKQAGKDLKLPTTPISKSSKSSDKTEQNNTATVDRSTSPKPDSKASPTSGVSPKAPVSVPSEPDCTPTASRSISLDSVTSALKSCLLFGSGSSTTPDKMIRPAICRLPMKDMTSFGISLSGCGFLVSYHFGAALCLVKNGQPVLDRLARVSGASAGCLVGALLLMAPEKLNHSLNTLYEMADELNSLKFGALTPGYYLNQKLIGIVDDQLPLDISPAQKRLVVSLTSYKTRKNVLVSEYSSRETLLQSLLASCYIPMYSMGYYAEPPVVDGKAYVDGGYSNNLPDFDDVRTITISPFSGCADICPTDTTLVDWTMTLGSQQIHVNLQNIVRGAQALFPPNREVLKGYYERGYKDTFRFLLEHDLLKRPIGTPV